MDTAKSTLITLKDLLDRAITPNTKTTHLPRFAWRDTRTPADSANDPVFCPAKLRILAEPDSLRAKKYAKTSRTLLFFLNRCQKGAIDEFTRLAAWILGFETFQDLKAQCQNRHPLTLRDV
jgi:hypothetical protein